MARVWFAFGLRLVCVWRVGGDEVGIVSIIEAVGNVRLSHRSGRYSFDGAPRQATRRVAAAGDHLNAKAFAINGPCFAQFA